MEVLNLSNDILTIYSQDILEQKVHTLCHDLTLPHVKQIIITDDIEKDITNFQLNHNLKINRRLGKPLGKVIDYKDGSTITSVVFTNYFEAYIESGYQYADYVLRHELGHCHDIYQKSIMRNFDYFELIEESYERHERDMLFALRYDANFIWSEYIASRLASEFDNYIFDNHNWFDKYISTINQNLYASRKEISDNDLKFSNNYIPFLNIRRRTNLILSEAAKFLGYHHGRLNIDIMKKNISFDIIADQLENTCLDLYDIYPSKWDGVKSFDSLGSLITDMWFCFDMKVTQEEERIIVNIKSK